MYMGYTKFSALSVALLLSACASKPEVVPSSGPRIATSAGQVKFYQTEPRKYEKLGNVTVSRDEGATWDHRGDATAGFDILKKKAAALGANGLLLKADEDIDEHQQILAGYHGDYYQISVSNAQPRHAMAQAIYVLEEK